MGKKEEKEKEEGKKKYVKLISGNEDTGNRSSSQGHLEETKVEPILVRPEWVPIYE